MMYGDEDQRQAEADQENDWYEADPEDDDERAWYA